MTAILHAPRALVRPIVRPVVGLVFLAFSFAFDRVVRWYARSRFGVRLPSVEPASWGSE